MNTPREPSKRAQRLMDVTEVAESSRASGLPGGTTPPTRHGLPGLATEFARADKASLDQLAAYNTRYQNGEAIPGLKMDPKEVSKPRFFNRFEEAFDPSIDVEFAALLSDIRSKGRNLVPAKVRPTPSAALPYELIYGERRMRACLATGADFYVEIEECSDKEAAVAHIAENRYRLNPSAVESALQVQSHLDLLGCSADAPKAQFEDLRVQFGYGERHMLRLRTIAQIPAHLFSRIPGVRKMSVRQGMEFHRAWESDSEAIERRIDELPDTSMTAKQAIAFLTGGKVGDPSAHPKTLKVHWPKDAAKATAVRERLLALEREFGVRFGLGTASVKSNKGARA